LNIKGKQCASSKNQRAVLPDRCKISILHLCSEKETRLQRLVQQDHPTNAFDVLRACTN